MQYSVVDFQSVRKSSHSMRLDADFFRPDYLSIQKQLEVISLHKLRDFGVEIKHPREITRKYVNEGVFFLRAQNVRPLSIDLDSNTVFISREDAEKLSENAVNYKDILLTRTGANFGQCAIYLETKEAIASSHTFIIRSGELNPFFLAVFFNTKYGRQMIDKGVYGGSQPEVAPYFLHQIPIPEWDGLQRAIEKVHLRSYDLIRLSKTKYVQAQALLMAELGLASWKPKHQLSFVVDFSDTQNVRRIDADYFQPKYAEIVSAIKGYSGGWDTLSKLVMIRKCIEVGREEYSDEGTPFVRVSNLSPFEISEEKYISGDLYAELEVYQPEQGEILFSKDATPGIAHYLRDKPHEMIPSGGILRLKRTSGKINDECLALILNSTLTKEQANRDAGGSVIRHWRPDQIANIVVPIPTENTQTQIQQMVVESIDLRKESKRLLECAKRAVEIAIEEDEATALNWLEQVEG